MRRVTAKAKKAKAEVSDNESTNQDEQTEQGNGDSVGSEEEATNEEVKTNSKRKNKRGKKKANNAEEEDDAPEPKKKKQNASSGDEEEPEEAEEYEVESIVDMKQNRGKRQFKIRWKGYGAKSDTWEKEEDLSCPEIIKNFLDKAGNKDNEKSESKSKKKTGKQTNKTSKKKEKSEEEEEEEEGGKADDNKEYEVEEVMEVHFKKNGTREFLIHWKGFTHKEDTWEPEKNLNCPELIEKFIADMKKVKKSRGPRELRDNPQNTDRFASTARRQSGRNQGKQRATYHDDE